MHKRLFSAIALLVSAIATILALGAAVSSASAGPAYVAGTPLLDTVTAPASNPAPWTLSQGDPSVAPYDASRARLQGGSACGTPRQDDAKGVGSLRKGVVIARLFAKHDLGRGGLSVTIDVPGSGHRAATVRVE